MSGIQNTAGFNLGGGIPQNGGQEAQQQAYLANLTPQQKMALALMQGGQAQAQNVNQQGQYSPMQGLSQLLNSYNINQMMQQKPQAQPDPTNPFSSM